MTVTEASLDGLLVITPERFEDDRGYFTETWNAARYRACGIETDFVQDNLSLSKRGVLRGLHFQNPTPQAKLVTVLCGRVFDVTVDLRRRSPTFGQWHGVELSEENGRQLYVPVGFAHGFVVTGRQALFSYKCSAPYVPKHERAIRWNDPDLGIRWPVEAPALSVKDKRTPLLRDLAPEHLFGAAPSHHTEAPHER